MLIRLDLPAVSRVRLADVDDEEFNPITKLSVEPLEVPSLGTKRRSGVATENQRYWLTPAKCGQLHTSVSTEPCQLKIRRFAADRRRERLPFCKELHEKGAPLRGH